MPGGEGWGALVSGIGDLVLSNIWHNEYYLADLSLQVYLHVPREYFFKVKKDRTNISRVIALVSPLLSDSSLCVPPDHLENHLICVDLTMMIPPWLEA
jgi:hypothetical protein